MAYMNQERKQTLAPAIKRVLHKYGMKGTIATRHYSTLIVNLKKGPLDIIGNLVETSKAEGGYWAEHEAPTNYQVNNYHIEASYTGKVREFLLELNDAMNAGPGLENHDRSDMMSDYHDVGWYVDINVGRWDKPYEMIEKK